MTQFLPGAAQMLPAQMDMVGCCDHPGVRCGVLECQQLLGGRSQAGSGCRSSMESVLQGLQQHARLFGCHGASREWCPATRGLLRGTPGCLGSVWGCRFLEHSSWASRCVGSTRGSPALQRLARPVSGSVRHGSGWVWGFTSSYK